MANEANIKIVLEAVNNAQSALEQVRGQLEQVGNTADTATQKTDQMGGAFSRLGGLVAGFAGSAGLGYLINEATDSDKSFVRMSLSLGRYSEQLKNTLIPQVQAGAKGIQDMGMATDELAQETIARLLPTYKNDLPRAIQGAGTLLTLMKYDVRGASAVLNFLGEDSDFARVAMTKLAKAVGIDVNPKMDDLQEILDKVTERLSSIKLPPFVQEMGKLLGTISDLAENVGVKILKIINPLLAGFNALLKIPLIGTITSWAMAFGSVALAGYGVLNMLGLLPSFTALVTTAWTALAGVLGAVAVALGLPVWGVVAIIAGLVALGVAIYKAITDWEGFKASISAIWDWIKDATGKVWDWIVGAIKDAIKWISDGLLWLMDKMLFALGAMVGGIVTFFLVTLPNSITWFATTFIPQAVNTIVTWFMQLPSRIANALASLPSLFATIFGKAQSMVKGILDNIFGWVGDIPSRLLSGVSTGLNWVIDRMNSFIGGYNAVVPKSLQITQIPHLAEGGIVTQPTVALIGERGAEAVIPLNRMAGAGGGGYNIVLDFSGSVLLSEDVAVQIGDKIIDRLRKVMKIPSRSF